MDKEEFVKQEFFISNEMIAGIEINELPEIISSQVSQIKDLGEKIEAAIATANNAKESADKAKDKSVKFGHKAEAITALQEVAIDLAQAQSDTADALKVSFEYEKKLGDITKYLFALGTYSIANTQIVIQQLSNELKKEGKDEKITDVAKQQLMMVINQLKTQEEVVKKQEILSQKVDEHEGQLKELDRQLDDIEEVDDEQDEKIAENAKDISKHAETLSLQQEKDEEHDDRILKNTKKIQDMEQDAESSYEELCNKIAELEEKIVILNKVVKRKTWKVIISAGVAIALLCNVLQICGLL